IERLGGGVRSGAYAAQRLSPCPAMGLVAEFGPRATTYCAVKTRKSASPALFPAGRVQNGFGEVGIQGLNMPDSQSLGLLIAATLAGIICLRLYWILARRTGHEPPPQPQAKPSPLSAPPPQPVAVEAPQTQEATPVSA